MANDFLNSSPASSTDWDKAWNVVCRLDAARKHLAGDAEDSATELSVMPDHGGAPTPIEPTKSRPLRRPPSVWILIGALWISIGLIISATIVALPFLL